MQSMVCFKEYLYLAGKVYAVFTDPQGGPDFILSHEECKARLGNLRDNSLSVEETEKALNGWPKN